MKPLIIALSLLFCIITTKGQNAFYQAQYLKTISVKQLEDIISLSSGTASNVVLSKQEKKTVENYQVFLKTPFANNITSLDLSALKSAIKKYNDFIQIEMGGYNPGILPMAGVSAVSLISSMLGGNFSMSPEQQTKIIDALTKYYAEEFKKAQLLTYMQLFEQTIGKSGELELLLPQTYLKLKNTEPSKFPELGDEYKAIFNEDLKDLLVHLENHIDNYIYNASSSPTPSKQAATFEKRLTWLNAANVNNIKANPYYDCFKLTADIGTKLVNNYHPVELFNYIDEKYYPKAIAAGGKTLGDHLAYLMHGINLFQRNLLDSAKVKDPKIGNVWLSLQELRSLDTQEEWTYFAGLLYQQDRAFFNAYIFDASSKGSLDINSAGILSDANFIELKSKTNTILATLEEIESFRANLKEDNLKENFLQYMKLLMKVVEQGNYYTGKKLDDNNLKKIIQISNYTLSICDNARKKDYSNSIYYLLQILKELSPSSADFSQYTTIINSMEKYGTFMTDVVKSKNSDELKEIIKKNVASPTSFILKRQYISTLSLTGQPGYFLGAEWLTKGSKKAAFVSGLTLPMGFELTFKSKKGSDNSGSIGLFLQLIDLGAVLNFRVSDSTSTLPDKIEFKQLFSPGGSLTYGFKNSPLTLALGYQQSPELRKVTLSDGNEVYPKGHRIFLRFAWDIPLINIYKSKGQ